MNTTEMKHYVSSEWGFSLDVPKTWNRFPPVSSNSPYEVIRFASYEEGSHLLIIFRAPQNPKQAMKDVLGEVQQLLAKNEFGNFATAETTIASRAALTLDFDRPKGRSEERRVGEE